MFCTIPDFVFFLPILILSNNMDCCAITLIHVQSSIRERQFIHEHALILFYIIKTHDWEANCFNICDALSQLWFFYCTGLVHFSNAWALQLHFIDVLLLTVFNVEKHDYMSDVSFIIFLAFFYTFIYFYLDIHTWSGQSC